MKFNDHLWQDPEWGTWYVDVYVDGDRVRKSLRTKNRRVAEDRAVDKLRELQGSAPADLDTTKLHDFLDIYLKHAKKQTEWSEGHKRNLELMIGVFKSIVKRNVPAKKFTKKMADDFFSTLSERKRRVFDPKTNTFIDRHIGGRGKNLYRRAFIAIWNLGITWDIIPKDGNVWTMVTKFPEQKKRPRYLTDAEINAILAQYATFYPNEIPLIRVYLATGMRRSELLVLDQDEVHFDINKIIPTKTKFNKFREIPMAPVVRKILWSRKDLPRPFSDMPAASTVTNHFIEMRRLAGIHDAKLHDTRKRFITEAIILGVPPTTVAEWAGHEALQVTIDSYIGQDSVSHSKLENIGHYETPAPDKNDGIKPKIDLRTLHTDTGRSTPDKRKGHAKSTPTKTPTKLISKCDKVNQDED